MLLDVAGEITRASGVDWGVALCPGWSEGSEQKGGTITQKLWARLGMGKVAVVLWKDQVEAHSGVPNPASQTHMSIG